MKKLLILISLLFLFSSTVTKANPFEKDSSSTKKQLDTNYVENCRKLLNTKISIINRNSTFNVKDLSSGKSLEYGTNAKANLGIGASYKGFGFEIQFAPHFLNNNKNDSIYGKTNQFSLAFGSNGRRLIYDVYFKVNQGFHSTTGYKIPNDTSNRVIYFQRPDIKNVTLGSEFVYIYNNSRFSSAAPYNFNQRQKKNAGSALLGGFFSIYNITADSILFPDSLKSKFKPEAQFTSATSFSYGISYGYTRTFLLGSKKYWYFNFYALPGLALQSFVSYNKYTNETYAAPISLGLAFQYRLSFGYNRTKYFLGMYAMGNNYNVTSKNASIGYHFDNFRVFYGYRFDLHREHLKKFE